MSIDTLYRIMSVGWSVGHTVKTTFPNLQNRHENASNHDYSSNHDDPDDHEMVQESVNMCLNVLKRPVSALYYKIISIYTTINMSLNLLTGLL